MSFAKAQRFNPDKVCGPPPTAYHPQQPGGSGVISFPKSERFRQDSTPNAGHEPEGTITRSHSSNSVGSTDSTATTKSHQGKKDHAQCNKQIQDLEKELRNITRERNQLLRRRNHPINATSHGEKTDEMVKIETEPTIKDDCPSDELKVLHATIQDMQAKLDSYKDLEEEKFRLEAERDNTVACLEQKEFEVARITNQIDELKIAFDKEETLRHELEAALQQAIEEKKGMEAQLSELGQKIENLENVRVEMVKEIQSTKEIQVQTLADQNAKHQADLDELRAAHQEQVRQLENNLQQLVAEHDAESEQLKFEYSRQIDELHVIHSSAVAKLESEHDEQIKSMQTTQQEVIAQLQTSKDELEEKHTQLRQECEEFSVTLETKVDEVETLQAQLEVANEKLETSRIQAEERFASMKRSLELDIAECQVRLEEHRRCEEEKLRTSYESKLAQLEEKQIQLTEMLDAQRSQSEEAENAHSVSCNQYEEQIKRLNYNSQTEKELLMWQMSKQREHVEVELKTEFDRQLAEKEAEFEQQQMDWETKLNQASDEHVNQLATIQSDHTTQLNNYRELHEAAIENLEREKKEILEERDLIEKNLKDKQVEIENVTTEMKTVINQLEFELEMLRESNNQLVADLLRVEQERQVTEEKLETEIIMLRSQTEKEKENLIDTYEGVVSSLKSKSIEKEEQIIKIAEQLSVTESTLNQQLLEKEKQLEEANTTHENRLAEVYSAHTEEIKNLHRDYERVISNKVIEFNTAHERLSLTHQESIENLTSQSANELQELQEEFRMTFSALERKLMTEKEELVQTHTKDLEQIKISYEEKLDVMNKHHEAVVEELNKNNEEAADNIQELHQSLDNLREEFQALLANGERKELEHQANIDRLGNTIQSKEQEIVELHETLHRREKETADEWIQRETSIMTQFTEQNQKSLAEFEDRLQEIRGQLQQAQDEAIQMKSERDAALDDVAVYQVQTEAQMAALNEQYEQERAMLIEKLSVQTREIEEINSAKLTELQTQLAISQRALEEIRKEHSQQMEQMEHEREEACLTAVREALEPVDNELEALRKDREAYLLLKKEFQELQARIEPFREQLDMYEAEKKALLNQALFAENSMATLASKYTQLLGHQNSKQKIHHLEKLKQDICNLRKELLEKSVALEKEKKARQKLEARVKELSGQKKYDPSEAFKVPENPPVTPAVPAVTKAPRASVARPSINPASVETKKTPKIQRKPLGANGTGFFLSMDDVEKQRSEMEQEKQARFEARRNASSANFEAFEVDFGNSAARRETFDVPPKLNVTTNLNEDCNKENAGRGLFPQDISGISAVDEMILKNKLIKSRTADNLTSTPLQRHT